MSQQGLQQASIRAVTGSAEPFEGDWHRLFDLFSIPAGDFDGRQLRWINAFLSSSYTNLPEAKQKFAESNGAVNWSSMGTFTAAVADEIPVNTVAPVASGIRTVGQTLTTTNGTWTEQPITSYAYKWQVSNDGLGSWSDIGSATSQTYILAAGQSGKYVRSGVLATNAIGPAAAYAFSAALGPISAVLSISGTPGAPTQDTPYTFTPTTAGGHATYAYSLHAGTLPAGLSLNTSTGAITGTPTTLETQSGISIRVTDADGLTADMTPFSLTVGEAGTLFVLDFSSGDFDTTLASFSRAGRAHNEQAGGLVEANWYFPRFDYSGGSRKGLLYEPAGTNQFPNSEALAGNLTAINATITANQGLAPDGTMTASRLQLTSTGYALRTISGSWNSQTHEEGVWVRTSSGTATFKLRLTHAGVADYDSPVKTATTTWQRFTFSQVFGASAGSGASVGFFHNGVAADIYVWGLDVRKNAALDSYIKNDTSAAITRLADAISFTIPSGGSSITYTFDDDSTQIVGVSPGAYTVPTNLNRRWLKKIEGDWIATPATPGASYTGPVATGGTVPDEFDGTYKQTNSRCNFRAQERLTSVQVIFPGWYVTSGGVETSPAVAATISASIEYPLGTYTPLLFGASASGSLAGGTNLTSDALTVDIPAGATFWVRIWYQSALGNLYQTREINTTRGDAYEQAISGSSDKTTSGTITNNGLSRLYAPLAIIGTTTKATVLLVGDSRTAGYWATASGDHGEIAPSVGQKFGYINVGKGNEQAVDFIGSHALRLGFANYCTHVILQHGINDLYYGRSDAQIRTDTATILGYFTGKTAFIATMSPSNDSSDSWKALGDQTVRSYETGRTDNNDWRRTVPTGFAACFDVTSAVESSLNSGKWKVDGTAAKYTHDGGHASVFAENVIRTSGVIDLSLITY